MIIFLMWKVIFNFSSKGKFSKGMWKRGKYIVKEVEVLKNKNIGKAKASVRFYIHVGGREGNEVVRIRRFIYRVHKIMA